MSLFSLRLYRIFAWLPASIALVAACSVPDYRFEDVAEPGTPPPAHCLNQRRDAGESAIDCGGGECLACRLGQTCVRNVDCLGGQCVQGFCQDASCADGRKGPGETDLDCGGQNCRPCGSGGQCTTNSDCASGICQELTCTEPTCDDEVRNGDELDVDCGGTCDGCAAGTGCSVGTDCASGICENSRCSISCIEGKGDCDGDLATDCETNVKTNPLHCGGCGMPCNVAHADPGCVGATCTIERCRAPYDDCNTDPLDGCETNLSTDVQNCVACGMTCSSLNGTPSCSNSGCQIACNSGFDDCNNDRSDGCEKSTTTDVGNCGGCNDTCVAGAGETPYCKDGTCGSTRCAVGAGNCNGEPADSCETNLLTDVENCGACGNRCIVTNGTATCQNGTCAIRSCSVGFGNCDVGGADAGYLTGCETNTTTSLSHCGACGTACSIANASGSCEAGRCRVRACTPPYQDCNADGIDCETNINTNKANCGGCGAQGVACDTVFANSSGRCEAGACMRDVCAANYGDCDANATNGCESDLRVDLNDCGQCNKQCRTLNATATRCSASVCDPTCISSMFDGCTDPSLGCSDRLDTPQHCGSCTNVCSASAGFCVGITCQSRLDVVLVNSNTTGAADNTLSLTHTLTSGVGQYRLVLLAVASLAATATAARPDTVTYAGRPMRSFGTPPTYGTPSAFLSYYFLVDSELPATAGSASVLIDSAPDGQTARLEANLLEFRGVEQGAPLDLLAGATGGGCGSVASLPISVVNSGSFIYSLAAYEWGSPATPAGMLTMTFDQDLNFGNLRGVGGYRGPLNAGSYSVGWSTQSCNNSAHRIIAIRPATTP